MAGKKPDRLGIMGGTFDPVHIGHLVIAEAAREKLGLQKVIFIPTGTPPHKSFRSVTDGRHRLEMVKRAIKITRILPFPALKFQEKALHIRLTPLKS